MRLRFALLIILLALAWLFLRSPLWAARPTLLGPCLLVAFLALLPLWQWMRSDSKPFPIVEIYCLAHIPAYVTPFLDLKPEAVVYPEALSFKSLMVVATYLAAVQIAAYFITRHVAPRMHFRMKFLRRQIPYSRSFALFMALLAIWWLITVAFQLQLVPEVAGTRNIVRTTATACGMPALFFLFFEFGKGKLTAPTITVLLIIVISAAAIQFSSGFLVGGASTMLLCLLAYSMGSGKVPVLAAAVSFLLVAFLHAGKAEVRDRFWDQDLNYSTTTTSPIEILSFWFDASARNVFSEKADEQERESLVQRGSMARWLQWAVNETPTYRPYLRGLTYVQTLQLFIPRILWSDKPRGTLPTETLAIYYGVQTEESVEVTSVSLGQIAEAWGNLGWLGVGMIGVAFGLILSVPRMIAPSPSFFDAGSFLSAVFLAKCFDLESCFGPWLIPLCNALLLGVIALFFISEREPSANVAVGQLRKVT
jgi:hypothetical protein